MLTLLRRFLPLACLLMTMGLFACQERQPSAPAEAPAAAYTGPSVTHAFAVEGMHCEGCVGAITDRMAATPGVRRVEVSLEEHRMVVETDAAGPSPAALAESVGKIGYQARLAADQ